MQSNGCNRIIKRVLKAVIPIIEAAGATWQYDPTHRGKHQKLFIEYGGQRRFTPLSQTPSNDDHAIDMKRADVRRILRELGAQNTA